MKSPIRVFSDLHLGHPGCRVKAVEGLRPLFEGAGTVIFNGDTTEQRHSQLVENGARQLAELKALLEVVGTESIFLRGNHDPEISGQDHLELLEGRVLVTHGDALFRHLSPWSPKTRKVIPKMEALRDELGESRLESDLETCLDYVQRCRYLPAGGKMEIRGDGLRSRIASIGRLVWPPGRPVRILQTWATIPRQAHAFLGRYRPEAELLLFGHTHFPGRWKKGNRTAINTGGFVSFSPARCVELSGDRIAIRRVRERDGEAFELEAPREVGS